MHQEVVYAISKPLRNRITDLLFLLCSGSGSPGWPRRAGLAGAGISEGAGSESGQGGPGGSAKKSALEMTPNFLIKKDKTMVLFFIIF